MNRRELADSLILAPIMIAFVLLCLSIVVAHLIGESLYLFPQPSRIFISAYLAVSLISWVYVLVFTSAVPDFFWNFLGFKQLHGWIKGKKVRPCQDT